MAQGLWFSPFYRYGHGGTERLGSLLKVMELESKWQNQDLNPSSLALGPAPLTTTVLIHPHGSSDLSLPQLGPPFATKVDLDSV